MLAYDHQKLPISCLNNEYMVPVDEPDILLVSTVESDHVLLLLRFQSGNMKFNWSKRPVVRFASARWQSWQWPNYYIPTWGRSNCRTRCLSLTPSCIYWNVHDNHIWRPIWKYWVLFNLQHTVVWSYRCPTTIYSVERHQVRNIRWEKPCLMLNRKAESSCGGCSRWGSAGQPCVTVPSSPTNKVNTWTMGLRPAAANHINPGSCIVHSTASMHTFIYMAIRIMQIQSHTYLCEFVVVRSSWETYDKSQRWSADGREIQLNSTFQSPGKQSCPWWEKCPTYHIWRNFTAIPRILVALQIWMPVLKELLKLHNLCIDHVTIRPKPRKVIGGKVLPTSCEL